LPWSEGLLDAPSRDASLPLGPRRLPGFTRLIEPEHGASPLTDDRCPIENLQVRSLAEARARRLSGVGG